MLFDDMVGEIAKVTPKFGDYGIRGFVRDQIDHSPAFPEMCLREGSKIVNGIMTYKGRAELSPEERVRFELKPISKSARKPRIPLSVSHFRLFRYCVEFEGKREYAHMYMPYMFNDMLMIRDKLSMIRKVIVEKTFSRVVEKSRDGVSVSPYRVNLTFNRRNTFRIESFSSKKFWRHFLVQGRLFHGPIKNKICDTLILHYMLAKFGFNQTLKRFGLSKKDVLFTKDIDPEDTDKFEYFAAHNHAGDESPRLFLKVRKTLFDNDLSIKFIVNLCYVLSFFDTQTIDTLYAETGSFWQVILGLILYDDKSPMKAYSNAESHIVSVDHFIDPITRDRFQTFGVMIEDIYDLLVHTFINIDSIMVNSTQQDLYSKRLDVANGILVEAFGKKIFNKFYRLAKKSNISEADIRACLRFNPMMINTIMSSGRKEESEQYIGPPEIVNDNWLFAGGLTKIRLGGRMEERLHPSMLVAENGNAFTGKIPGKTGSINPFIPVDRNGSILHPEYAHEIDEIMPYLPPQ